jgi:hypothetical protein
MTHLMATDSQRDRANQGKRRLSRRSVLSGFGAVGMGALAGCFGSSNTDAEFSTDADDEQYREAAASFLTTATLYKTPGCECCLEYTSYLEEATDADIEIAEVDDLAEIKDEYNVPRDIESCHTMDAGEYFVEGHVPQEAIGKLAIEEPDVAGIALPEMPQGSPGMPGEKDEEFVIYAVYDDASYDEFMRI